MSYDPFLGEIALFPYAFAPTGWAWCNGQLLPLNQNTALFALLGVTYGGDGRTNFALPNLNGRTAMGWGQGPGLSAYRLGQEGGSETVTLLASEMPAHAHVTSTSAEPATTANPAAAAPATGDVEIYHSDGAAVGSLAVAGGSQPHNNMQPYLTLRYAIALQGIFPPRS